VLKLLKNILLQIILRKKNTRNLKTFSKASRKNFKNKTKKNYKIILKNPPPKKLKKARKFQKKV
jgi:hypothetical protein